MRDADGTAAQRDALGRPAGRAERLSATRRNAGSAVPSPSPRIVPAARSAAPGTRRGAGRFANSSVIRWVTTRGRASITCVERGGVPPGICISATWTGRSAVSRK